ncbi:unnamed protein product [Sphagnum balticum]
MELDYQDEILHRLANSDSVHSNILSQELSITPEALYPHLVSLLGLGYIKLDNLKTTRTVLTKEGLKYAEQGTPEAQLYHLATVEGTPQNQVEQTLGKDLYKIAFPNARKRQLNELTSAHIADGSWEKLEFKQFNPTAKGQEVESGNLHPLIKTKEQFVSVLLDMGFEEMQTDRYVESSFWNFDALFQPHGSPPRGMLMTPSLSPTPRSQPSRIKLTSKM